jgi:hypothetical protein
MMMFDCEIAPGEQEYDGRQANSHEDGPDHRWRGSLPPDCDLAVDRIGGYLADDLDDLAKTEFCNHMRECVSCHDKLIALEALLYLVDEASTFPELKE